MNEEEIIDKERDEIERYLILNKFQKYNTNFYQRCVDGDGWLTFVILDPLEIYDNNENDIKQKEERTKLLELSKIYHGLELIQHMLNWFDNYYSRNNGKNIDINNTNFTNNVTMGQMDMLKQIVHNTDRRITIHTWGIGIRRICPIETEMNFDISDIHTDHDRKSMKNRTGLEIAIQNEFLDNKEFLDVLIKIIETIEENDLHNISICCSQGRHRSVSMAEIIKRNYYPHAILTHIELC